MKKFKNFIPLDYKYKENIKSQFRINRIIKLLILVNLIFLPISITNIKEQFFNKEKEQLVIDTKGQIIAFDKIEILMNKSKEFNGEIKINNNDFIMRTTSAENNEKLFNELYKSEKIKVKSINYGENVDEIKGVLNE